MVFAPFFAALAQQPAPVSAPPPIARAVRLEPGPRETRLIFSLSACVAAQSYVLDRPARAIVDLSEVNFQIDPDAGLKAPEKRRRHSRHRATDAAGLVASYRFGRLAPGKSRIVVDLSGPAEMISSDCAPAAEAYELSLSLAPQAEAAFRTAARAGAEKQAAAALPQDTARDKARETATAAARPPGEAPRPVVVLDPGHGGIDTGAIGRDRGVEKFLVLDFAKALASKLRHDGHYRVVLTREDDVFVPLRERVRMARDLHAELFVSLHADALAGGAGVQGATVYTVSERASDAEAARVAEQENKADSAAGVEAQEDASDVNDILFDLTRRETRAFSHVFAHSLSEYWKVAARLNKNPRRSAGFVVLKAPDVPSVLLELGYLSNDADAADLSAPAWREKAAAQVARAIDAFFASRQPEQGGAPAPDAASGGGALKATQSGGN
ncbi:N-acetylmuramoyl-L-alanine amidase [uncultured Rhodoblastus sp.]|uniref:N-acetylmuramoyl-L-alanine amidase n=1 Tax=uncultured Rhodoblastus sp. TaxID=543037 RepID=UPI0025FE588E|nr:N-acetylmuramoyl-L-alanine amidase [uncultured Rhodoblastus sp.]